MKQRLRLRVAVKCMEHLITSEGDGEGHHASRQQLCVARDVRRDAYCGCGGGDSESPQPGEDLVSDHWNAAPLTHLHACIAKVFTCITRSGRDERLLCADVWSCLITIYILAARTAC
jgi:hypothetical protein